MNNEFRLDPTHLFVMNRVHSPSTIRKYPLASAASDHQSGLDGQPTSEIYKHTYQSLMDIDPNDNPISYNPVGPARGSTSLLNSHTSQATNSPCRRPRSPSDNELLELDDFNLDPKTKMVINNRKKSKTTNANPIATTDSLIPVTTNVVTSPTPVPNIPTANSSPPTANVPQQSNSISVEAKAFAQSRHPFPPFILRFSSTFIDDHNIVKDLCKFLIDNKKLELELTGYRKSSVKCASGECDLLLFVKNSLSFSILYDDTSWPNSLLSLPFTKPSTPPILPQFSIIVKNVSLLINLEEFANDIRASYASVLNVIRMKNKQQSDIKLVKVEFDHPKQRDELLKRRKLLVNSLAYDVDEYLAPARVLICNKCMGIGHFRKQCQQELSTCKKCGLSVDNINDHLLICSTTKCKHCQGEHLSNDMRCPVIKQFRADLTKCLFSPMSQSTFNHPNGPTSHIPSSTISSFPTNSNQRSAWTNRANNNLNNHAAVSSISTTVEAITTKLDVLTNDMKQMNSLLAKVIAKNEQFELFIKDKSTYDELTANKIIDLTEGLMNNTSLITQHELKINRHENVFNKIIFPMLEKLSRFVSNLNNSKQDRPLDADFSQSIKRMRAQLNNVKLNKDY